MDRSTQETIIIIACISSFILCCCLKCCRDIYKEKELKNSTQFTRKQLLLKNRIKPISQIIDEEYKNEFEKQYETRTPQITGEENV